MTMSKILKVVIMLEHTSMNTVFGEKARKDFIKPVLDSVRRSNIDRENSSQELLSEYFIGIYDEYRMEVPPIEFVGDSFKCSPGNLETDARGSVSDGLSYALELCKYWTPVPQNMSRVPLEKHIFLVSGMPPDGNVSRNSINYSGLSVNALTDVITMNQILVTIICPKSKEIMYKFVDQNDSNATLSNSSSIDDIALLDNFNNLVSRLIGQRNTFKGLVQGGTMVYPQTLDLPLPPISNEPSQQEQIESLQEFIEAKQMLILEHEQKMAKLKRELEQKLQKQQTTHPVTHHQPAEDYSKFTSFEKDDYNFPVNMDVNMDPLDSIDDLLFTEDERLHLMCGVLTTKQTDVASLSVGAGSSCSEFPTPKQYRPFTAKVTIDFIHGCLNHWPVKFKSVMSSLGNNKFLLKNQPHHNAVKISAYLERLKTVMLDLEKQCLEDLGEECIEINKSILYSKVENHKLKDFRVKLTEYIDVYRDSKEAIIRAQNEWNVNLICLDKCDEQLQNLQKECEVIHGILEIEIATCTSDVIYRGEAYEVKYDGSQVTLVDIPSYNPNSVLTWGELTKLVKPNKNFIFAKDQVEDQLRQNANLLQNQSPMGEML